MKVTQPTADLLNDLIEQMSREALAGLFGFPQPLAEMITHMKANEPDYELECARTEGNAEQDSPVSDKMWEEAFHQAIYHATPDELCEMKARIESRMRRIILDHNGYATRLKNLAKSVGMDVVHFSEPPPAQNLEDDDDRLIKF